LFNLLCIPPYAGSDVGKSGDVDPAVWEAALAVCEKRRAMLIVDSPRAWKSREEASAGFENFRLRRSANAAIYFPRSIKVNPLTGINEEFASSGAIAGIIARTDATRGVWTAPAGPDATILGITDLSVLLTETDNAVLNALGINCLRKFPAAGLVVWGSRTLRGADTLADDYKYVPVRRTALFIEESLYRGLQWTVFEPSAPPLWSIVRSSVSAFMHGLFQRGAFPGLTPEEAYFVKCDSTTITQNDIDNGRLIVVIGFAPVRPAEFIIISIGVPAHKPDS
jgi:uncharacterized protein